MNFNAISQFAGHLERKHNILPGGSDCHPQTGKRNRSCMDDDDNSDDDDDDYYAAMEQHAQKRACTNANSTSIDDRRPIDAIIPRPMLPPPPPAAIGNVMDASCNANRQPSTSKSTSNVICIQNKAYNVVYMSDRELNKFMRNGRVGVNNGRLVFNDSNHDDEFSNVSQTHQQC